MKRFILALSAIATLTTLPMFSQASAQANFLRTGSTLVRKLTQPEVKLNLSVHQQVVQFAANGQEKISWKDLGSKAVVQPGDVLRYSITGNNIGDAAARNLVLNQAVPPQMRYVLNSADSNANLKVSYSINGGKDFSAQPVIQLKQGDGSILEKPAPAELYTHVRWEAQGDLPANQQIMASYEVTVR